MESEIADLIQAVDNNSEYFDNVKKCQILNLSLSQLKLEIEKCVKAALEIKRFAHEYDFDEETSGNGYWSFLNMTESAIRKTSKVCKQLIKNRTNLLFSADNYAKELDEWKRIFGSLSQILDKLIELHQNNKTGTLHTDESSFDCVITRTAKHIDSASFYGKNVAFSFVPSMRPVLKLIVSSFASYYDFFSDGGLVAVSLFRLLTSFTRNVFDPIKRADAFIRACEKASTEYCKAFWFLTEGKFLHTLPSLTAKSVEVNKIFEIQTEPMKIHSSKSDEMIDVPIPSSHIGLGPVNCRLLSKSKRKGMLKLKPKSSDAELSKYLIFHVHGGGFAAQTSKSHEIYLREWAVKMDVPILSINYSLTPRAPFPRALEEIFYAYCWALNNPEIVGSTGENIVFVGDSAGANLITACTIKCIETGVRKPMGVFNIYGIFLVNFSVTPARFLSLIDPSLPYVLTCHLTKSYCEDHEGEEPTKELHAKQNEKNVQKKSCKSPEEEFDIKLKSNYLISPLLAPDEILAEFPPTKLLSTDMDPLVDDNIEMGKRLKGLNVPTTFDFIKGLPHGFLYFGQFSKESLDATMVCLERIKSLLEFT